MQDARHIFIFFRIIELVKHPKKKSEKSSGAHDKPAAERSGR